MGEKKITIFVNFCLHYMADLDLPKKRCVYLVRAGLAPVLHLAYIHITPCSYMYLVLPCRGTFIEFRNGLINVCPVGRNCTREERMEFFEYDKASHIS